MNIDDLNKQSLLLELGAALLESSEDPAHLVFPQVKALAKEWHALGGPPGDLVRELAAVGAELGESVAPARAAGVTRLEAVVGEATAQALEALMEAGRVRHDRWLSYYCHEMRNYMNTLVNAHWILKNAASTPQQQRVCDMAERAVRKLENAVKDLRDLEKHVREPAPGRPDDAIDGLPRIDA